MKSQVLVLCSVLVCGVACAQPPVKSDATANPPVWKGALRNDADFRAEFIKNLAQAGPASVASIFLAAVQGEVLTERGEFSWEIPALCVAGVEADAPWLKQMKLLAPTPRFSAYDRSRWYLGIQETSDENRRVAALNLGADATIEIEVTINAPGALSAELRATEKLTLRRETLKWPAGLQNEAGEARVWRIVPPKLADIQKTQVLPNAIGAYALLLSDAEFAFDTLGPNESINQGKNLGLGFQMFLQDFDEIFAFDETNWHEQLKLYLASESLFTAPGDAPGTISYSFNRNLAGKSQNDINDSYKTVLLYLGKDEKLDFRYKGRATVVFADGHVKMVGPKEVLQWNP